MGNKVHKWREWAGRLKQRIYALYLAYKDPRVRWYAKIFGAVVVAYAFSPIDLIPDFIPILGFVDDLILLPLGIALAIRMIPREVMSECYAKAERALGAGRRRNWIAGGVVVTIWAAVLILILVYVINRASR
jgi:uncharacterized membrane protein YkvA (DUF1232 family)